MASPTSTKNLSGILVEFVHLSLTPSRRICSCFIGPKKKKSTIEKKIIKKPVLKFPDFNQPFQVRCDASGTTIGVVLSQEYKPVAYFGEKFNESK